MAEPLSPAKRRVLDLLKRRAPLTAAAVASELSLTPTAVRQHLAELERHGLVAPDTAPRPPGGRGRPSSAWRLTDLAVELFPDHHAELSVELIGAVRRALGEVGLRRVIEVRTRDQLRAYRALLPAEAPPAERVQALAEQRTREGYMAEAQVEEDGSVLLVEHHCPVCDAAAACQGLCKSELEVFRKSLGRDVTVEREQHLLSGDTRCVYRIRGVSRGSR